jgi:hypothetical protein
MARARIAGLESFAEPRTPTGRRTVRERLRVHPTGRHLLQPIVPHGGSGQPFGEI